MSLEQYAEIDPESTAEQRKLTDQLLAWLKGNGAEIPGIYFEYYAVDYRGVCSSRDTKSGETVMSIPVSLLLTVETATASPIGQRLAATGLRLQDQVYVACMLLQEELRGTSSFWHPYLAILPKTYNCMPVNFTSSELAFLEGSEALSIIHLRNKAYRSEYHSIVQALPDFPHSLSKYIWARLAVLTRIFGITIGEKRTSALVPMADMLNHVSPAPTHWTFDNATSHFTITAMESLVAGAQIFDTYGLKSSLDFLMNYGFVPSGDNPSDECKIVFRISPRDPWASTKWPVLVQLPHVFHLNRNLRDQNMWRVLRILAASAEELSISLANFPHTPLTWDHERRCLELLREHAQRALDAFPTTVDHDVQELLKDTYSRNVLNAIRVRLSEKKILLWYIDLCDALLDLRQKVLDEHKQHDTEVCITAEQLTGMLAKHSTLHTNDAVARYINDAWLPLCINNTKKRTHGPVSPHTAH